MASMLNMCRFSKKFNINLNRNLIRMFTDFTNPDFNPDPFSSTKLHSETKDNLQNDDDNTSQNTLYPEHIPTSIFQKVLLSIGSAAMAIADPYRDDMVAVLGETTGYLALKNIHNKMLKDPEGQAILRDKPRINSQTIDLRFLQKLPDGTLGHAYFSFLSKNKVSPDTRQPVHFVDNVELAYVMQRYREVHDLIHAMLNMPINMMGEVVVKWIEGIQTGLPMCIAGGVFGPIRFTRSQRQKYLRTYLPWALECSYKAKFFMNVYYEQRWEQPLEDLYKELNILTPPTFK
ncbi:ubiquinone biosynthesis protein COQ4 homolog, mitochondrial [Centruroides vittatus]|uniref:ubiquinone biosynthesis protein COQ4 homolog, mitochondrial n=1 Tax=Centruroides vittatus TaxID=120091 RepID=UPI00350EC62F